MCFYLFCGNRRQWLVIVLFQKQTKQSITIEAAGKISEKDLAKRHHVSVADTRIQALRKTRYHTPPTKEQTKTKKPLKNPCIGSLETKRLI